MFSFNAVNFRITSFYGDFYFMSQLLLITDHFLYLLGYLVLDTSRLLVIRISSFPNNLLASFFLCPSPILLKCGGMILIEGITGPGLDANTL